MKGILIGAIALASFAPGAIEFERLQRGETVVQDVTIEGIGGISASFYVHAKPGTAFAVLADTSRLAEFMPGMKRCTILERLPSGCVVKMVGDSGEMVIRRLYEPPDRITWTLVSGTGLQRLHGSWQVEPSGTGSILRYTLCVRPMFPIPQQVVTHFQGQRLPSMVHHVRSRVESGGLWLKNDHVKTEEVDHS